MLPAEAPGRTPRVVATRAADPNPWGSVPTPTWILRDGAVDLRWRNTSGTRWNQAGTNPGLTMLATTDEREARVAMRAFAQLLPGVSALYQNAEGVWLLDPQIGWDNDAQAKRTRPDALLPTLVDPWTGQLIVEVQRRNPDLVAIQGDGFETSWPVRQRTDDPWSQPLPPWNHAFRKPTPVATRPLVPAFATEGTPFATVEYTNPHDSTRRRRESLFVDPDRSAFVGDRPSDAVSAARALATAVNVEVAIWLDGGNYWLFPVYGRDLHLPSITLDAPNAILRSSQDGLQAIVGAGATFDPHGLVAFNGPDDADEPWRDSYLAPGDARLG